MKDGGEAAWAAGATARAAATAATAVAAEARRMRWVDDMSQVLPSISSPADSRAGPVTRMAITAGRRPARRNPCYGTRATDHIGRWDPAPALSGQDGDRAHLLVEEVQRVRRVVHVVDAVGTRRHGQTEQGPRTGRRAARVVEQEF